MGKPGTALEGVGNDVSDGFRQDDAGDGCVAPKGVIGETDNALRNNNFLVRTGILVKDKPASAPLPDYEMLVDDLLAFVYGDSPLYLIV